MSTVLKFPRDAGHGGSDEGKVEPFVATCAFMLAALGHLPPGVIASTARALLREMDATPDAISYMEGVVPELAPMIDTINVHGSQPFSITISYGPPPAG